MPKEVKMYCVMDGDKVVHVLCSPDSKEPLFKRLSKSLSFTDIVEIPPGTGVCAGEDLKEYVDKDICKGKRSLKERYDDGLVKDLGPELKVDENNQIVDKTDYELIKDGLKELGPHQKLDEENKTVAYKTWSEKVADGTATYEEWLDQVLRPTRNQILSQVDIVYLNPERWFSLSEEKKQAWADYKQQLRDFPSTNPPVADPQDIEWPVSPVGELKID